MLSRALITKDLILRTEYGGKHLVVYLDQSGEILDISTDRTPRKEIRYQARQAGLRLCSLLTVIITGRKPIGHLTPSHPEKKVSEIPALVDQNSPLPDTNSSAAPTKDMPAAGTDAVKHLSKRRFYAYFPRYSFGGSRCSGESKKRNKLVDGRVRVKLQTAVLSIC